VLEFRVLGPLEVLADGRRLDLAGPRQRAVLAALVIDVGAVVSADRLIDELWGDAPPASATGSLQAYVSNLRRVLEPDRPPRAPARVLASRPPGYVLQVEPDQVDAVRFERRLAHARALLDGGHPPEARRVVAEALGLWRGPAYADFAFEPFAASAIARLEELRLTAEEVHGEALLRSGDAATAVAEMERLAADHPLRERVRELLVWALYRCGRQADALRECDAARALLREELGVDPGPGLARLEAQILDHDPALGLVPPSAVPPSVMPQAPSPSPTPARQGPGPAASPDARPFVGRATEMAQLHSAWAEVSNGRTRGVFLTGEAGIGKTRIAEELGDIAAADGARVAWARCGEDSGAPALWPWHTLLRTLTGTAVTVPGGEALDPMAARLARFQALEALADALEATCRDRPVVAVIDDLQWADEASHDLLELTLRTRRDVPLLVLATVRTGGAGPIGAPAVLGRLSRHDHVRRIELGGLLAGDVEAYVTALGLDEANGLGAQVHARTSGNAFFVAEALRWLADRRGDLGRVPDTVVEVVRTRVGDLPDDCRELLTVASVAGVAFSLDLIRSACEMDVDAGLDAVEPALTAQLVREDDTGVGRFRFAHPIVQEAIYAALPPIRTARLHRRIADLLADAAAEGASAVEIAHHYRRAAAAGPTPRAGTYAARAAEEEEARLAFLEAAAWRERALALEPAEPGSSRRHELLVELGRTLWLAGDLTRSQEVVAEAVALAERLDDPQRVVATAARADSFTAWGWWPPGDHDPRVGAALERALGDDRLPAAAAVAAGARLAVELVLIGTGPVGDAVGHAAAAVAAARRLDDPLLLARALQAQLLVGLRPGGAAEQLRAAVEMTGLGPPAVPVEVSLVGRLVAASAGLALGDPAGFDEAIEACWQAAAPLRQPAVDIPVALARVTAAMVRGDIDAAEDASVDAYERYARLSFPGREDARAAQILEISRRRGDLGSRLGELDDLCARSAWSGASTLVRGVAAVAVGDLDRARAALAAVPEIQERADFSWLYRLSLQAEIAAATRSPRAARYYDALLPHAGDVVVLATAVVCRGSVDHLLGLLARHVAPDAVDAHRAAANRIDTRLGAALSAPWPTGTVVP
jgi:DNA-binding SARP family transcriptional activator